MTERNGLRSVAVVAVLSFAMCSLLGPLFDLPPSPPSDDPSRSQRLLRQEERPLVYPWARDHLRPLDVPPDPSRETAVLWNIPKSGGGPVRTIYECLGVPLAEKAGADPKYGHGDEGEVATFRPWPGVSRATYVNVDATTRAGLDRARDLGLVPSGLVDLVVTGDVPYAVAELFDESHKGRMLAMFRHPVDRLVSKFFYLQKATWEEQYRPQWGDITVLEWARDRNKDNNYMVKKLAGLGIDDAANEEDLRVAMRTVRKRCVVGLLDRMEESVRRFNVVLGVDGGDEENRRCMSHLLHDSVGAKRYRSESHPKVDRGSATWNALAKKNELDIRLYEFILGVFEEQREVIDSYEESLMIG